MDLLNKNSENIPTLKKFKELAPRMTTAKTLVAAETSSKMTPRTL